MEQFIFVGVIEDIMDPEMLGRVKIRVAGIHTSDKTILPTEDLPWALFNNNINSASVSGIGESPTGIVEGSWCTVMFLDQETKQIPLILGTISGFPTPITENYEYLDTGRGYDSNTNKGYMDPNGVYPLKDNIDESDVNRLARGQKLENTIVQKKEDEALKDIQCANPNPVPQPEDSSIPDIQLSEHYNLKQLCYSNTAVANKISNTPPVNVIAKLKLLCNEVLEKIWKHFNAQVFINSSYRGPALNALVNGATNSQHLFGEAADIEIYGIDNKILYQWIIDNLDFDQVILEYYDNNSGGNSGWVHVSI